jgi:hypothetical protein
MLKYNISARTLAKLFVRGTNINSSYGYLWLGRVIYCKNIVTTSTPGTSLCKNILVTEYPVSQ